MLSNVAPFESRLSWAVRAKELLVEFVPYPNTGRLWQDCFFLICIAALQLTILPSIFGVSSVFDLLTPWLVISCVQQRVFPVTILIVIAALAIEGHSARPVGMYFCCYWIMMTVIVQMRPTLSWRHRVPWMVTFTVAELWIVVFEGLAYVLISGNVMKDPFFWILQVVRILISTSFGLYISRKWQMIGADEPVPQ